MQSHICIPSFSPFLLKQPELEEEEDEHCIIVQKSTIYINEINNCIRVRSIVNAVYYYLPILGYEELAFCQLKDKQQQPCVLKNSSSSFLLIHVDKNKHNCSFLEYVRPFNAKKLIHTCISGLLKLLESLILLRTHQICFLDMSPSHIVFNQHPWLLGNFRHSLWLPNISVAYLSTILSDYESSSSSSSLSFYLPFELHFFYYLREEKEGDLLTQEKMVQFCNRHVNNLPFLNLFSHTFCSNYESECIQTLLPYINKSPKDIRNQLLIQQHEKWEVYGISVLFILLFGHISRHFSLKETWITQLLLTLVDNIHPNQDKRRLLSETLQTCQQHVDGCSSWNFVQHLNNDHMDSLFQLLHDVIR